MAREVRMLACDVVIALLLFWIFATQGFIISSPCTLDNCTSTRLGDLCSSSADCWAITNTQCRNDTCRCISGYISRNESQECVPRTIYDQCEIDSDCADAVANSYCHRNRTCLCPGGYQLQGSNCVARKLNDECNKNSDCTKVMNNTRCVRKNCTLCINQYLREDNDTCKTSHLGDSCVENMECNPEQGQLMVCPKQLCVCAKGYRQALNDVGDSNCVKVTLGSECSKKADCSRIPYSECGKDRRCQCVPAAGRRPSANNETCDVIQLNDDCLSDVDCQYVNNSACVEGKCSCATGYTDVVGGSCRPLLLGDPCGLDSNCVMANAVCSNKICSCMKGFAVSHGSNQCTQMIVGDTECRISEDCLNHFPNTACDSMGLCQCERQYHLSENGSECLFRYVGDACSNSGECLYSVNSTECNNNICKCIDTHLPSADKTDCILKNLGGRPCTSNAYCSQLVPHSFCDVDNSNTCFCNTGYSSNENFDVCLEKRLLDPCLSSDECITTNPNTVCSNKTQRCECSPEFAPTFPETAKNASKPFCSIRKIGHQSCQTKEECSSAIANSTCGWCEDAPDASPCLQRCGESSDVTGAPGTSTPSSRCPERTCICERGFVKGSGGERCEMRKLREPCRADEDCNTLIPNSVCLTGRQVCYCAAGFKEDGSYTCTRRKIEDFCRVHSDCQAAVPSSYCNASSVTSKDPGVCACNSGYQAINAGTECRKRQIGDRTCQNDRDCSDAINNSKCHHQMCICNSGYYRSFDHTQCIKRKLFEDYCDHNRDCSDVIPNAVCDDRTSHQCICPSGYYPDNGTECRRRNINDTCRRYVMTDCSDAVTNSTCVNGVCMCVSGFFAMGNDTCLRRKINDANCRNPNDCADAVGNSSCQNGTCLCDRGYYPSGNGTVCSQRKLNDSCSVTSDCDSVIPNSNCTGRKCECKVGFDVHAESSRCVPQPTKIGDVCYFKDQCRIVDNASICNVTDRGGWRCLCPLKTFTAVDNSSCIKYPEKLGDTCQKNEHCTRNLSSSKCEMNNSTCVCQDGYIEKTPTSCVEKPRKLGDFCLEDVHCNITMSNSKCDKGNGTCICEFGYRQKTRKSCVERDRLPQYQPIKGMDLVTCQADTCNWTNSRCEGVKGMPDRLCRCDYRHALPLNSIQCVPIQTYELELSLVQEAGKYDYKSLEFLQQYSLNKTPIYTKFADRVTLSGLMMLFSKSSLLSSLKDRYVSSEVVRFHNLSTTSHKTGVRATLLLHMTANYMDATPTEDIHNFIEEYLNGSGGLLGQSALKLATPYRDAVVVRDYDECEAVDASDCSDHATCINTLGSYMCVCNHRYEDISKKENRRPGRVCKIPTTTQETSDLCSSSDCKTRWEFVGLAVTLFLLIVTAFITYEIIQRKKTFTARKLYEKFGTTKIRKLRQASMQRLHERKKRKKAENKIKKEEEKQKKEDLKREKSQKKRLKDEERKAQLEEKKLKDLEKKEANRSNQAKSSGDVEWLGEEEEERHPPSPAAEAAHPAPSDDSPSGSLPGSVNDQETEMIFPKIVSSPIEESNV